MKLSIGIVGMPNVGKSTLFNLLTKQNVLAANYPFATIDPNVGIVPVPDERLDKLTELGKSKKRVPAVVEFYDIAGLVKGANQGEGLGNQFLAHIRETQAIVVILRVFKDENVVHVESTIDPIRDLEIIKAELILKDLDTLERRILKAESEARSGDKKAVKNLEILKTVRDELARDQLIPHYQNEEVVKEMQLLSAKKQLYLLNGNTEDVPPGLIEKIQSLGSDYLVADLGKSENLNQLIKKSYEILNLVSFFTTGEDESRAWTIERGTKAPQAAGVIHTDFEHKFIRAEVVSYDQLISAGGWNQAKQKGFMRLEGKEYEVKDGDVMVIRHG